MRATQLRSMPSLASPFTYFEDRHGIIYYSHGVTRGEHDPEIRATAVYFAGEMPGHPQRVSWLTGQSYFKFIMAGLSEERANLGQLPIGHREALSSRLRRDPHTNEHYLAIPVSEVRHCFSPWEALEAICPSRPAPSSAPAQVRQAVTAVLEELTTAGIPRRDLGLYGGLQCGIAMADETVHDVDILVLGNSHYRAVVDHCRAKELRWVPDERIAASPLLCDYEHRRVRVSQSHTSSLIGEVLIDIRLVPTPRDHQSSDCAGREADESLELVTMRGRVVDASASLSLPACLVVAELGGSGTAHVVSAHHHLVGAAHDGDLVKVTGMRGVDGTVHVLDEERHGVVPLTGVDGEVP